MTIDKSGVGAMFDAIAWRYDFLNHFLTLGIDNLWRRKAVSLISAKQGATFLDVATGTGDLAVTLVRHKQPAKVIGIDISAGMLAFGKKKMERLGLDKTVTLRQEDCEALTLSDSSFEAVTVGFGIRNFLHPEQGLSEMHRVLKSGGELIILEFSRPTSKLLCKLFDTYFCYLLPLIGKVFSKHGSAYTYLPESVKQFPYGENFAEMMRRTGFTDVVYIPLTFGVATVYKGVKK
jgi:demethylmenaquinone methyltransferase/2-methoxy-6-polyprenyl-1,4-benzoquinol methylase